MKVYHVFRYSPAVFPQAFICRIDGIQGTPGHSVLRGKLVAMIVTAAGNCCWDSLGKSKFGKHSHNCQIFNKLPVTKADLLRSLIRFIWQVGWFTIQPLIAVIFKLAQDRCKPASGMKRCAYVIIMIKALVYNGSTAQCDGEGFKNMKPIGEVVVNHVYQNESANGPKGGWWCVLWNS